MKKYLRPGWLMLYLVVILGWSAWYVPQLNAERYREPIHQGLERALGRKVTFGTLQFRLLPLPGFTISDLIIAEDPTIGPEPSAYVKTLQGRPRLSALFGGPLEFASVDLEETSVNLTRTEGDAGNVRWNFSALIGGPPKASLPVVHIVDGRVNFKFGDTKTVFYLLHTDADLWPPDADGGPWTLKVRAEPARTDRPSHGFGSFVARGEWRPRDGSITIDVKLEKSELSDVATLFQGSESGLHGKVWGGAHFAGPANRVGLAGRLNIDDIHGWNQPPTPGSKAFPVVLSGVIDARNQIFDIRALSAVPQVPLDLRYRVQDFLGRPRWGLTALFSQTPLAPMAEVARHMGLAIPEEIAIEGTASGVLGYSLSGDGPRLDGGVSITGLTATPKGAGQLKLGDTALTVSGARASLASALVSAPNGEKAVLDASWNTVADAFEFGLSTEGMAVDTLKPFVAGANIPLLSQLSGGSWSGTVHSFGGASGWAGDLRINDSSVHFDAFSEPIHISQAEAQLDDTGTNIRRLTVTAAGFEARGDYRYERGAAVPHLVHLTAAEVDGSALEKFLAPTLNRAGLLNKALNFGKVPVPEWLQNMHAGGTLQISNLKLGPMAIGRLKSRLEWNGEKVVFSGLTAQTGQASLNGTLTADLAGAQPGYEFAGKAGGIVWHGGAIEAEGSVSTNGAGTDLVEKLAAKGTFTARNIDLLPLSQFPTAQGPFELSWPKGDPRLSVLPLSATAGGASWTGSIEPRANGEFLLKLTSGSKSMQGAASVFGGEPLVPAAHLPQLHSPGLQ